MSVLPRIRQRTIPAQRGHDRIIDLDAPAPQRAAPQRAIPQRATPRRGRRIAAVTAAVVAAGALATGTILLVDNPAPTTSSTVSEERMTSEARRDAAWSARGGTAGPTATSITEAKRDAATAARGPRGDGARSGQAQRDVLRGTQRNVIP